MGAPRQEPRQALYRVVAQALQVDAGRISPQASPETIPSWDSLRSILLVTAVEERYQVQFTLVQMMAIRTVGDLEAALAHHGIALDG